jgi:hypothetical protein
MYSAPAAINTNETTKTQAQIDIGAIYMVRLFGEQMTDVLLSRRRARTFSLFGPMVAVISALGTAVREMATARVIEGWRA